MMLGKMMSKGGVPKPEDNDVLSHGAEVEAKEHPWATPKQAKQIARDHINECGAGYYEALEEMEKELEEGGEKEKDEDAD
jgi:hypothetical protein